MIEISYIAHACFKVKTSDLTMVFDPYDPDKTGYKMPKLDADLLLISHEHGDHNYRDAVSNYKLTIESPGEFESKGVFIYGIETYHDSVKGEERGKNTMYLVEAEDITMLHAGDLGHELSKETLEQISSVDILLIPVGGTYTIDAKAAAKVISSLEPGIVIPMHYQTKNLTGLSEELDGVDKFLNEMGVEGVKKTDKLKIKSRSDIPDETEVVVLNPEQG